MTLSVVVDGGGSGCRLNLYDKQGRLIASTTEGPANLSQGEERAWENIRRGINKLAESAALPQTWMPDKLGLGLAGALQDTRREKFLSLIPACVECTLVTDGHAQLLGASGGGAGICLAVGTGSVLHWIDRGGSTGMSGGWGFPVADEGSGAWLGMKLVAAFVQDRDSNSAATTHFKMSELLREQLRNIIGQTVSDIQLWTTCKDPAQLASLVPCLSDCAKASDPAALALIDAGATECLRLINTAPMDLPVYLAGGLKSLYQPFLERELTDRLCEPHGTALDGLQALLTSGCKQS